MSEARRQLPTLLEKARQGDWQLIGRRGRAEAVLAGAEELEELLGAAYRFHPGVDIAEQGVGVWLPELETHGAGATLDEAMADLADVVIEYAEDWVEHLRHAPNHRARAGYVRRIQLAGGEDGVRALLERDAAAAGETQAAGPE